MDCFENQIKATNPLNSQENCLYAHIKISKKIFFPHMFLRDKALATSQSKNPIEKEKGRVA